MLACTLFLCTEILTVHGAEVDAEWQESGLLEEDPVEAVMGNGMGIGFPNMEADTFILEGNGVAGGIQKPVNALSIPNHYDPRMNGMLPSVRNQGGYSVCWSFAALAGCEINSIVKHVSDPTVDLSENHLVYFSYHMMDDPLHGITGDGATVDGDRYLVLGNCSIAYHTLLAWKGAVSEEEAPYDKLGIALTEDQNTAFGQDVFHLTDVRAYNTANDQLLMKGEILRAGSVQITYNSGAGKLNPATNGYYTATAVATNHAVTLVGWDDSYSKNNFLQTPQGDGAWLVRNSAGEIYGDHGYFWLSYYDKSIGPNAYALYVESADNYDNNYQYDGTVFDSNLQINSNTVTYGNAFTAKANPTGRESLEAVGFYTSAANLDYQVQIHSGKPGSEMGESLLDVPLEGSTTAVGYYTVPLSAPITLEEGQDFSVILTMTKQDGNVTIPVEGVRKVGGMINSVAAAMPGQSFLLDGENWVDWGAENNKNFRVKAYTKNLEGDEAGEKNPGQNQEDYEPKPDTQNQEKPEKNPADQGGESESENVEQKDEEKPGSEVNPENVIKPETDPEKVVESEEEYEMTEACPFTDIAPVEGSWRYEAAKSVYAAGLMTGVGEHKFAPNQSLTRGMVATILYRLSRPEYAPELEEQDLFLDVTDANTWYYAGVNFCKKEGIIKGYPDGTFCPDQAITREELAKMLWAYDQVYGKKELTHGEASSLWEEYPDGAKVSSWAREPMDWCIANGILTGKKLPEGSYLDPQGLATRIECAAILARYVNQ